MKNKVILEKKGYKAYIILDKPEKLNALDMDMYDDIGNFLHEVDKDPDLRVLIIKGNGRAFSAGYDIEAEADASQQSITEELIEIRDICNANRWKIWNLSKPVIAQIHGYALGGALELALPCDYVIAAESATIGEPEISFGALPVFMMSPWLTGLRKSKELLFTGERMKAPEAAEYGLITRAVPDEELTETVEKLADKLIRMAPPILSMQKKAINGAYEIMGLKTAIENWQNMNVMTRFLQTPEIEEFNRIADEQGTKAALKWRDEYFSRRQDEDR